MEDIFDNFRLEICNLHLHEKHFVAYLCSTSNGDSLPVQITFLFPIGQTQLLKTRPVDRVSSRFYSQELLKDRLTFH